MDDTDLDRGWIKVPPILDALKDDFEFVVWFDIDALILRLDRDIVDEAQPGIDLLVSWHGPEAALLAGALCPELSFPAHYNSGVYLIRRSNWSRNFFERMLAMRGQVDHLWSDQAALLTILGLNGSLGHGPNLADAPDRSFVRHLDAVWNSIPGIAMATDPIIHHFAGLPHETRLRLMESDVAMLETYETGSAEIRSALSRQMSLWTAAERRVIHNDRNRAAEVARLRAPRQMLRDFPHVVIKRLREKARGNR